MDKWPGTKAAPGVAERLINMIPPHACYVAPFAGHCAVASKMRPAARRIFCDLDRDALRYWNDAPPAELHLTDGIGWLRHFFQLDRVTPYQADTFARQQIQPLPDDLWMVCWFLEGGAKFSSFLSRVKALINSLR